MFKLVDKSDYSLIKNDLKRLFECKICHLLPKKLNRVCANAHFFCNPCAEKYIINSWMTKCWICNAPYAIKRLTVFNYIIDLLWNIPVDSSKFIDQLIQILECPVCYEEAATSLNICDSGHVLCKRCFLYTKDCPICRGFIVPYPFTVEIQRNLEEVLLDIPCFNQGNGCQTLNKYNEIKSHRDECSFDSWLCSERECSWTGILQSTISHAKECHPNSILEGKKIGILIQLDKSLHVQLWKRRNNITYFIFYKALEQGLKIVINQNEASSEEFIIYNRNDITRGYSIPCLENTQNLTYFLKYECPTVPMSGINKTSLQCLIKVKEVDWYFIITTILKAAVIVIKIFNL